MLSLALLGMFGVIVCCHGSCARWACLGWLLFQGTLQSIFMVEGGLSNLLRHKLVLVGLPVLRSFSCKQGCGGGWVTHTLWPNQNLKLLTLSFLHRFTLTMFEVITGTATRWHTCLTFQVPVPGNSNLCTQTLLLFTECSHGFTSCKSKCWKDVWLPCMCISTLKLH